MSDEDGLPIGFATVEVGLPIMPLDVAVSIMLGLELSICMPLIITGDGALPTPMPFGTTAIMGIPCIMGLFGVKDKVGLPTIIPFGIIAITEFPLTIMDGAA